ncbi:putative membrane protein YkvI [Melghiribacillus thermohalophilus]|uniref:Putative membrane protein YkvI n=1 Tax=Melghiribacillus thermohalophilus TaxID=1324956 RepID=A0A4R3N7T4_9BACI|nr:hypothetical protein [Melghiribacillus thermohalophilus]TCT24617.1 putative membrane protein YkvI [Melghiribacillus thermohalophilus]
MWKAGFKWMFLIIGSMIGAGYASGRELWQFFGHGSSMAILLFTILFSVSCYIILSISFQHQTSHYVPVLRIIVGKHLTGLYDMLILFYLFTTTVIMIAGSGATLEAYHFNYWFGIAAIAIPIILTFVWDIDGILSINSLILPLLILGLSYVLILFIMQQDLSLTSHFHEQQNWMAAFPFTALNIIPLIAVLGAIGNHIEKKGEIWVASVGSGLVLGIITYIYNNSLIQISEDILLYEIPLFAILKHYPYKMFLFMTILLWIAIFTTALSCLFGLISRIRERVSLPLWMLAFMMTIFMVPFTSFGFANLIKYLYPIYGILNLYALSAVFVYPIMNRYKIE